MRGLQLSVAAVGVSFGRAACCTIGGVPGVGVPALVGMVKAVWGRKSGLGAKRGNVWREPALVSLHLPERHVRACGTAVPKACGFFLRILFAGDSARAWRFGVFFFFFFFFPFLNYIILIDCF